MKIIHGNVKISGGEVISVSTRDNNGLYPIRSPIQAPAQTQSNFTMTKGLPKVDLATLHRRMGHITGRALEVTAKEFSKSLVVANFKHVTPATKGR